MRTVFLFIILLCAFNGFSSPSSDGKAIKRDLLRAIESSHVTDSLYDVLTAKKTTNPLHLAYIGTLEALKAKHAWNPYHKLKFVGDSQKTLAKALSIAPHDMEIRFMRFTIQHYTPSFLGFSKQLKSDKKILITHFQNRAFGNADKETIKAVANFLLENVECTSAEQRLLRQYT